MPLDPVTVGVPAELFERLVAFRRDLHRHPEPSQREERTAARIAEELVALGLSPRTGVGGHGVVVDLPGTRAGVPAVALRADMDALPLHEETGLPFASTVQGVMHACGHDAHAAMLLGAAALLAAGPRPPAPVRLLWQPAEEKATGARALLEAGVLEGVGAVFGGHVDVNEAAGVLLVTDGPVNASSDAFVVDVHGRSGHGARPHQAVDALLVAAQIVLALQTVVSREVDPARPAVLSVGLLHAGTARNVVAGHARLEGTLRAQEPAVRAQLQEALARVAEHTARAHRAEARVAVLAGTPPVVNDERATALARQAARQVVGAERVAVLREPNMGAEDFGFFLQQVPGCYVRFGARPGAGPAAPAHSSRFELDEGCLATGAGWFAEVARVAGRRLAD